MKEVFSNLVGFIYSLSVGDYFFFNGTLLLIVLFIYILYLIKCSDEEEINTKEEIKKETVRKEESFNLEEVCKNIEKDYKPEVVRLTSYEEEQENNAIISYDELIKNKDKIMVAYDDEYPVNEEVQVRKLDLSGKNPENTLEMPKLNVKMLSYDEEESFLNALKELQKDLSH